MNTQLDCPKALRGLALPLLLSLSTFAGGGFTRGATALGLQGPPPETYSSSSGPAQATLTPGSFKLFLPFAQTRQALSQALRLSLDSGQLNVLGTPGKEELILRLDPAGETIEIDDRTNGTGTDYRFELALVQRFDVALGDGDDLVIFDDTNGRLGSLRQLKVDAGDGDNTVIGSTGNLKPDEVAELPVVMPRVFTKLKALSESANALTARAEQLGRSASVFAATDGVTFTQSAELLGAEAEEKLFAAAEALGNAVESDSRAFTERFTGTVTALSAQSAEITERLDAFRIRDGEGFDQNLEKLTDEAIRAGDNDEAVEELANRIDALSDEFALAAEAQGSRAEADLAPSVASLDGLVTELDKWNDSVLRRVSELEAQDDDFRVRVEKGLAGDQLVEQADRLAGEAEEINRATDQLVLQVEAILAEVGRLFEVPPGGPFQGAKSLLVPALSGCGPIQNSFVSGVGTQQNDLFSGNNLPNITFGLGGSDEIHGQGGMDWLFGNADKDCMFGEGDTDFMFGDLMLLGGSAGDDEMDGGGGRDLMFGNAGDDEMDGDDKIDFMFGNAGDDTMHGNGGEIITIVISASPNIILKFELGNFMWGNRGTDTMYGDESINFMWGNADDDRMHGNDCTDFMWGNENNDEMYGDTGKCIWINNNLLPIGNFMWGHRDVDKMYGGGDNNFMWGNREADTMNGDDGMDFMWGDEDIDTMSGNDGLNWMWGNADADTMYGNDGTDIMEGNDGTDTMFGNQGLNAMWGNADKDIMFGNQGLDLMSGNDGDDTMNGNDGFNVMWGNLDADTMFGDDGFDIMEGNEGPDTMFGNDSTDWMNGNEGCDTMHGGDGFDLMYGNRDNDMMFGDAVTDLMWGDDGHDTMNGNGGIDFMWGNTGNDTMRGDADTDLMWGNTGNDCMDGGAAIDWMEGNDGADTMHGDDGNNMMWGRSFIGGNDGADHMYGGTGKDLMWGNQGDDALCGNDGIDWMFGNEGNDTMHGDGDINVMWGNDDDDTMYGGDDNDKMFGNQGADALCGNDGNNSMWGREIVLGIDGDDQMDGGAGNNNMWGNSGADTMNGDDGNDKMFGNRGDDNMDGDDGSDKMFGNQDDDTMFGGSAFDWMFGNADDDWMAGGNPLGLLSDLVQGNGGNNTKTVDGPNDSPWTLLPCASICVPRICTNTACSDTHECDLAIQKTVSPNPPVAGQPVTFSITVSNVGHGTCEKAITMADVLPPGFALTSVSSLWSCWQAGATVACMWTAAPPGTLPPITITGNVTGPQGSLIQNCATVSNPNDTNPVNNVSCISVIAGKLANPATLTPTSTPTSTLTATPSIGRPTVTPARSTSIP